MPDDRSDREARRPFRAFYDWLKRGESLPDPPPAAVSDRTREHVPSRVAHYAIVKKLGEGGMGVVYAARDDRLERTVALKMLSSVGNAETARRRFWREARAAASVNHPHICQIYEIGEDQGELFIAMELLEGEPLAERLTRGAMSVSDTLTIGLEMLAALAALHSRSIVHRDLKPSNVFLTPYGVKLLDFGLARPELDPSMDPATALTHTGMVVGTPRYMAPEQVMGDGFDARGDLFAAGAILFEMLAGRPAFAGRTVVEVLHATVYEQPPALTGSPAVAAVDRVIRRALAKKPADRPASADAMADELRGIRGSDSSGTPALAHALTRLVVLPFRVLRPDPETDFLAFSLPDAIATSLSGVNSLIVRSSATAARFADANPDLREIAAQVDVDRVVMGTLLRAGDEVRAVAQLVEAPSGTLLASHTVQTPLGDLFRLQDDICRRVVEGLSLGLTGERPATVRDVPHNPRAYEFFLRGNELSRTYEGLVTARGLYQQAIDLDPGFAPAWAQIGRVHRVIGKFIDGSADSVQHAEAALQRALELSPRLSLAHKFYAHLEADMGQSSRALVRLLGEATRHGNDPELFAGLVHACRYCGLFDESIAAHAEARRLDPNVPTSVEQTMMMVGRLEELLALEMGPAASLADEGIRIMTVGLAGRRDEARQMLIQGHRPPQVPALQRWGEYITAWLNGRGGDMRLVLGSFAGLKIQDDPEALFIQGWLLCDIGEYDVALEHFERAVERGYFVAQTLAAARQFDALRDRPRFRAVQQKAETGREQARAAFLEAGGAKLLGL